MAAIRRRLLIQVEGGAVTAHDASSMAVGRGTIDGCERLRETSPVSAALSLSQPTSNYNSCSAPHCSSSMLERISSSSIQLVFEIITVIVIINNNKKYVLSNSESVQCNFFIFDHVTFTHFKICCCI